MVLAPANRYGQRLRGWSTSRAPTRWFARPRTAGMCRYRVAGRRPASAPALLCTMALRYSFTMSSHFDSRP